MCTGTGGPGEKKAKRRKGEKVVYGRQEKKLDSQGGGK